MTVEQEPIQVLDMSFVLRTTMAARGLSVAEMAKLAGVSKSAMEKYLSGPSSPRAVAVASLSRALGLSADTIMFGELDGHAELAHQLAFQAFARLLKDLKSDADLSSAFANVSPGTDEFADFVRNVSFERAGQFKREFDGDRREAHFQKATAT